jgi:hypothetical protein
MRPAMRHSSTLPSQRFRRYDSGCDGDGATACVKLCSSSCGAPYPDRPAHYANDQIQKPGDVVICLASCRPNQTFLLSFRKYDRIGVSLESVCARGGITAPAHFL